MTHEWSFQNNHTIYIHGNIIGYIDVDDSIMSRTVETILVVPLRKKKSTNLIFSIILKVNNTVSFLEMSHMVLHTHSISVSN